MAQKANVFQTWKWLQLEKVVRASLTMRLIIATLSTFQFVVVGSIMHAELISPTQFGGTATPTARQSRTRLDHNQMPLRYSRKGTKASNVKRQCPIR